MLGQGPNVDGLTKTLSPSGLQGVHSILKRAIRQARARNKVLRNVAVTAPKGRTGHRGKALTPAQATCTRTGTPLDAGNIRRAFRGITRKAKIGETWTPRERCHSFVSIMSDNGAPIKTIGDLVGHAGTAVTEKVYRHQLKPVITNGAETMDTIFSRHKSV